eukprot:TRINITY_DN19177_c0_g1_i1.p1 TRINITY_DN19177_c0_g1~~TRINITY_DN19177_c0_g1_i1.p1  ORF type:complete len:190 (+),score=54.03 TRINITY_DN19177_c0_g1_i1:68-637(+)
MGGHLLQAALAAPLHCAMPHVKGGLRTSFDAAAAGVQQLDKVSEALKEDSQDMDRIADAMGEIKQASAKLAEFNSSLKSVEADLMMAMDAAEKITGQDSGVGNIANEIATIKAAAVATRHQLGLAKTSVDSVMPRPSAASVSPAALLLAALAHAARPSALLSAPGAAECRRRRGDGSACVQRPAGALFL